MNSHSDMTSGAPLDLSKWKKVPDLLMYVGAIGAVLGLFMDPQQFGFSWLVAFMFYLSFCLGSLGMVILHHLFDASWSVPIRRICEQLASLLFPWMLLLFVPIAVLAPKLYVWMSIPHDHAVASKQPLFTMGGFYLVAAINFGVWWLLSSKLRKYSLKQDQTGDARCTVVMRRYAAAGVFLFAFTLTLAAIMWMKALEYEWFSTMYGVWYFASSMWSTLFTLYALTVLLKRQGPLREVATDKTFYFIGSLMFAFTVFYAYVTFFQYFIIWNANIPEEVFWFIHREKGTWWDIGQLIIFGHFFLPFLLLLRIDVKVTKLWIMLPLGAWAWLMLYADLAFQIMPVLHPDNFVLHWMDLACLAFMGGVLTKIFVAKLLSSPIVPQRDPRMAEALDIYVPPASAAGLNPKTGGGH